MNWSSGIDEIEGMSDEHLAEALETVGADYIGSGSSGFADIDAVDTFMSLSRNSTSRACSAPPLGLPISGAAARLSIA